MLKSVCVKGFKPMPGSGKTRVRLTPDDGVKSQHSYSIIMTSGLEQTHRNSAILGCLTLSSIFASFSTFLKFASVSPKNLFTMHYCSVFRNTLGFHHWSKTPLSNLFVILQFSLPEAWSSFKVSCWEWTVKLRDFKGHAGLANLRCK